jgi:uncharacterized membrane-anchored protein YhcB (DUF1043 family)
MWDDILTALQSKDFIQGALLIIVAGIITGIFVPIVKSRMDNSKFKKQKKYEAKLKQQGETIKAQTSFLAKYSELIWEYLLLISRVCYNRVYKPEKFESAFDKYSKESWELLGLLRACAGSSRWFSSDSAYNRLTEFDNWLMEADDELFRLKVVNDKKEWDEYQNKFVDESRKKADEILMMLTKDYDLERANV